MNELALTPSELQKLVTNALHHVKEEFGRIDYTITPF